MSEQNGSEVEVAIDGEVVQEVSSDTNGRAVAVPAHPPIPALAVAPQGSAKELVARLDAIKEAQEQAMVKNVDYGVIPGTDKPTLYKPGAEKLAALFQLDTQPTNEKRWEADGHLTVVSRVTIYHVPTGARLGAGEGICTTREKKYGKRMQDRVCPDCSAETIKRSKFPPRNNPSADPGWYCFAKIGGCGANFDADDKRIVDQVAGEVDNPDLPDLWNTVDKIATKRALVAAVLIVTGASAVFTQDVEDMVDSSADTGTGPPQEQPPPQATARERASSERPITGEQKGKVNARLAAAGLTAEEASAVRVWYCAEQGVQHFDRLPTKQASYLINQLREDGSGARGVLDDLKVQAAKGHEVAQKILARMEGTDA